jgi:putative endonuclease
MNDTERQKQQSTRAAGDAGERLAELYLKRLGYRILETNYRFEHAEIDLICEHHAGTAPQLVFVEVKTRYSRRYGRPEDAVGETKRRHLYKAAEGYMLERRICNIPARIDVIAIIFERGLASIHHIRDAFS